MIIIPKFSVKMKIKDILYLSYLVPASRIRPLVPDILPLATVGDDEVFISIVTFHCMDVRLADLPSLRFSYDQINLRTYVRDPYTRGHSVYFFRSGITSSVATFFTRLLKLPWEHMKVTIKLNHNQLGHCTSYIALGHWHGKIQIEIEENSQINNIHPFKNQEEAISYLTEPFIGFYKALGRTYRFEVKHPKILSYSGKVRQIQFLFPSILGIVEEREIHQPSNILLAHDSQFHVFLPPRLIK